jgi:hypothetical protein
VALRIYQDLLADQTQFEKLKGLAIPYLVKKIISDVLRNLLAQKKLHKLLPLCHHVIAEQLIR